MTKVLSTTMSYSLKVPFGAIEGGMFPFSPLKPGEHLPKEVPRWAMDGLHGKESLAGPSMVRVGSLQAPIGNKGL